MSQEFAQATVDEQGRPQLRVDGGLVVAHTHLYSALARGMPPASPPPGNFFEILQRVWWRLDRALDRDGLAAAAQWGLAEAVGRGATCVIDHHESPGFIEGSLDVIADAMQELGVRGAVAYGITARNFGSAEWRAGLAENIRFLKTNRRPLVRGLVGIHAAFTVPDQALREAAQVARDFGVGLHVHVAEDAMDRDALERLAAADALVPGSVFGHGVHATPEQVQLAAQSGVWWVHNPRSNAMNRVGYAELGAAGAQVALGTDGMDGDMLAEARAAMQLSSATGHSLDPLDRLRAGQALARQLFGGCDDATVFDYAPPTPLHPGNVAGHLLFGHPRVSAVQVDGRRLTLEHSELAAKVRPEAMRMWQIMAGLQAEPEHGLLLQRLQS
ncbi:MAG: amidohydrolase family protein [Deltaproteobacteria bacterium]|nr:amidohydrolase family protein [Deltaproteobacteria bacterium]